MKKILSVFAATMILGFTACGTEDDPTLGIDQQDTTIEGALTACEAYQMCLNSGISLCTITYNKDHNLSKYNLCVTAATRRCAPAPVCP